MPQARTTLSPPTAAALGTWAAQRRSLLPLSRDESIACTLGRLKYEKVAAGSGDAVRRQHWPEVYRGDGAVVQAIVVTLTELPRCVLTFYWVLRTPWTVPIKVQAHEIGVAVRAYWDALHVAEAVIDSGLQLTARLRPSGCTCGLSGTAATMPRRQ
jgi:hypothetical protein